MYDDIYGYFDEKNYKRTVKCENTEEYIRKLENENEDLISKLKNVDLAYGELVDFLIYIAAIYMKISEDEYTSLQGLKDKIKEWIENIL